MVAVVFDDKAMRRIAGVLDGFGRQVRRPASSRAISQAMAKSLRPIQPDIRVGTPKDTGALARSVGVRSKVTNDGEPFAAAGWRYKAGKPRFSQMLGVEYGNDRYHNPPGTLMKVWKNRREDVLSDFLAIHLPEVVDKILARQAQREKVPHRRIRGLSR